jgi:hypothetical protein
MAVQFQIIDDLRRDPARAHFVAGEDRSVHDDDVEARLAQSSRTGRPRWSSADNQDVTAIHPVHSNSSVSE